MIAAPNDTAENGYRDDRNNKRINPLDYRRRLDRCPLDSKQLLPMPVIPAIINPQAMKRGNRFL